MKKTILTVVVLVVLIALTVLIQHPAPQTYSSYKTASYMIDGKQVILGTEGTAYFGDDVVGDLTGNGDSDVAFLITSQPGGSGTFYYLAVAQAVGKPAYVVFDPVFIGDRIAPQAVMIEDHGVLVSYATRRDNEPMTTNPHIMVSSFYQMENGKLVYKGSR